MSNLAITVTPSFDKVGKAISQIKLGKALQDAVAKFAFSVERESKKVTPVDTGRLRASIATDVGTLRATIAPHTNYAVFVHEGTRFMKGRPFMDWGLDKTKQTSTDEIVKELTAEIERNINKI